MNKQLTVLVIDDDKFSQKFVSIALKDHYLIVQAEDEAQGIGKAIELQPDIVLLNVLMPHLNGYEVCKQLKDNEQTGDISVVFLSEQSSLWEKMQSYASGGDDYLVKPFTKEDLLARLNVLVKFRAQQQKLREEIEAAKKTALNAISTSGEYGHVLHFVERTKNINSYDQLAKNILLVTRAIGLNCCLLIDVDSDILWYSSKASLSPLETELMTLLRTNGRFKDFGCRTQINYPGISLLVKNMPLDDREKYGRIKDLLPALISVSEAKLQSINMEKALVQQTNELVQSFDVIRDSLATLSGSLQQNQQNSAKIMRGMLHELTHALPGMGLEGDQETYILNCIDYAIAESMGVIDTGETISASFGGIVTQLQQLVDRQTRLIESILNREDSSASASQGENPSDELVMNVELF